MRITPATTARLEKNMASSPWLIPRHFFIYKIPPRGYHGIDVWFGDALIPQRRENWIQRFKPRISFFLVVPTPGHSDDHVCLYEPNEGWLFSGDLFLSEQMKYLREEENIFSIIDSLKKVAALHPKKMFCSFNGLLDHPTDAIYKKIEYLENLQKGVEEGFHQGLSPKEIQKRLLGGGDHRGFITSGEIW